MLMWHHINEERDDKSFRGIERVSWDETLLHEIHTATGLRRVAMDWLCGKEWQRKFITWSRRIGCICHPGQLASAGSRRWRSNKSSRGISWIAAAGRWTPVMVWQCGFRGLGFCF
jgi:hypothetical protein